MTSDDNHDEDAQLQQLRAVWVSMRDEDPPDRGLASLMAAARTKAVELEQAASPSWWQRIAATLRRPPVLALATVTLLLGGALFVTQRSSQMKVDDTTDTTDTPDTQAKGDHASPATGSSAVVEPSITSAAEESVAEPATPVAPPTPRAATSPKKTKPNAARLQIPRALPEAAVAPGGAGGTASPVLPFAHDDAAGGTADSVKDNAPPPPLSSVAQLVKQCETAAARGDCGAVRVIAQKILTTAPATYKNKVANNAAINRCMPAPAATSAAE